MLAVTPGKPELDAIIGIGVQPSFQAHEQVDFDELAFAMRHGSQIAHDPEAEGQCANAFFAISAPNNQVSGGSACVEEISLLGLRHRANFFFIKTECW